MKLPRASVVNWLFGPGPRDGPGRLWPRWLFLRTLGLIFFSAFYSLLFQIRGLNGPQGILPAGEYLQTAAQQLGWRAYWFIPSVYWFDSSGRAMMMVTALGLIASVALVLNLWPRAALVVCFISYLSFVSAAQDFSSYQSDGMLLAAGFISFFFAPPGLLPGLGEEHPPSRASLFLLLWLWFRIYFESGIVKLGSHDVEWRNFTALDHYYSNGPLPNWIGWYVQHLPHRFHAAMTLVTLFTELAIPFLLFAPRRFRLLCFFIVTPFQIGIILTANLAFINHLTLILGFLLLDDQFLRDAFAGVRRRFPQCDFGRSTASPPRKPRFEALAPALYHLSLVASGFFLTWLFYVSTFKLLQYYSPDLPLPETPVVALEPFRIANQYGLFAVMTRGRFEIEFQGSNDGENWVAYPFRYKPQDPMEAPGWYAPYQPRFDWNLWFASLGPWQQSPIIPKTLEALLSNNKAVLPLFAGNPFENRPPTFVRAVMWQYWFADMATKHRTGAWWIRKDLGLYAPELGRTPDGNVYVVSWPSQMLPPSNASDEP